MVQCGNFRSNFCLEHSTNSTCISHKPFESQTCTLAFCMFFSHCDQGPDRYVQLRHSEHPMTEHMIFSEWIFDVFEQEKAEGDQLSSLLCCIGMHTKIQRFVLEILAAQQNLPSDVYVGTGHMNQSQPYPSCGKIFALMSFLSSSEYGICPSNHPSNRLHPCGNYILL